MGWQVDPNDPTKTVADAVSPLKVMAPQNLYSEPEATEAVYFSGNIDSADTAFDSETGKLTSFSIYDNFGRSYTVNLRLTQREAAGGAAGTNTQIENEYVVNIVDILDSNGDSVLVTLDADGKATARNDVKFSFGGVEFTVEADGGSEE